ncbi:MAG: hypothetical protein M0Z36_10040 [Thermaerobacter sp.]|nr:hypothetical protein [Thermaerobacter sp.]
MTKVPIRATAAVTVTVAVQTRHGTWHIAVTATIETQGAVTRSPDPLCPAVTPCNCRR